MDRYQAMFARLAEKNQGAFVPFVTVGDPNPAQSLRIMQTLVDAGADALELGIPFSDPLADGPTIQGANIRALDSGTTPDICFDSIAKIRQDNPGLPIGLLMYANLVYANGIDSFYERCANAGIDSVLIADVPTNESQEFVEAAHKHGIHPIFIAPPTASDDTLKQVSELGGGYTYLLSRAGVTGAETKANMPVGDMLDKLNQFDAPPALLGFGISEPEQVKQALEAGAAGAISGSAVVKIIEANIADENAMLAALSEFISPMKAATQK
ncbi:Tryptophan synthase alpha chain [Vibrio nigripulchritudo SFn27]|uniref:Tryptophan synthase alpha chain n=1 Tax=Vibrio nigripulchritudo TaxID=28173 RepID=U4KEP5_9VIBR|nr:tryptophan synthase subunit alpha [Vibrio nigripulchritudo]CCN85585.1 Tryptophan synthase alpha chain [Vibrio nigripulchritudo BLFn1]CCN87472.1 Tryptophan synthase alpha chain [Vibrio nigripulchritudo SFn27]CCN94851.1 Tryptophan synthase alpha chain [Vibrio nigripulchritudo ENn2]CCO40609.1 Tryptophan synthase alpha chain [Vibrio nigripulchritudo SFn135]CCO54686.1 Tryptophan synthase alpha chain [Vibrio nigripulchritudo Wn13]